MIRYWIAKPISKNTKSDRLYLIDEIEREYRHDLEVESGPYQSTKDAENAAIKYNQLLHKPILFLDFFEEDMKTVWCWKDEGTTGVSQIFKSKNSALEAWEKTN